MVDSVWIDSVVNVIYLDEKKFTTICASTKAWMMGGEITKKKRRQSRRHVEEGTSFYYCAYVLGDSGWSEKRGFLKDGTCYFLRSYGCWNPK